MVIGSGEAEAFAQIFIIDVWGQVFINNTVGWPNGKALDYESRDCRFDPCVDQNHILFEGLSLLSDSGRQASEQFSTQPFGLIVLLAATIVLIFRRGCYLHSMQYSVVTSTISVAKQFKLTTNKTGCSRAI